MKVDAIRQKKQGGVEKQRGHSAGRRSISGEEFCVRYAFDAPQADRKRETMEEMALYTVETGSRAEQFFYNPGGGA